MRIESIEGYGSVGIEDYVLSNQNSLFYVSSEFINLICKHLNASAGWLVARDNTEILGVLPFIKGNGPFGPAYNSMAFYGSNGGVVQAKKDEKSRLALINAFYAEAQEAGACSATIITNPLEEDSDFYETHTAYHYRDERIGQITHLPESKKDEDLLAMFSDPRPRNIRRAEKEGVEVAISNDEKALKFLHQTHKENMLVIGGIPKELEFFDLVNSMMPDASWNIFMATIDGKPIAALLLFYFNKTVEYFTPAVLASHRRTQALALVIYEAMKDATKKGYKNWNWGGTWLSQDGVYKYKKRWGTTEYPYFYYTQIFNKEIINQKKSFLTSEYRGLYIIPFVELKPIEDG